MSASGRGGSRACASRRSSRAALAQKLAWKARQQAASARAAEEPAAVAATQQEATALETTAAAVVVAAPAPVCSVQQRHVESLIAGIKHVHSCQHGCSSPVCASTRKLLFAVQEHRREVVASGVQCAPGCGRCHIFAMLTRQQKPAAQPEQQQQQQQQ